MFPLAVKLNLSQTSPDFMCLQYKSFENAVGKGEIARNEQFHLFSQHFLPVQTTFHRLHQLQNCSLQTLLVYASLKFVVWEKVKEQCKLINANILFQAS